MYPTTEMKCDRCVIGRLGVSALVLRSIMGDAAKVVERTASEISETSAHAIFQEEIPPAAAWQNCR